MTYFNNLGQGRVGWRTPVAGGVITPPPPTITSGLYSVYNADNNMNDSFGSRNGTAVGGLTYTTGLIGQAFNSNGSNSYIRYSDNSFSFTAPFSVSLWVKTTVNQTGNKGLFSNYFYNGLNYGYIIFLTTTNKINLYWNNTSDNSYTTTNSIVPNQWNHIVIIWDKTNTNWKVYINNVLDINVTTAAANNIRYFGYTYSNICGIFNDANNSLNGSIDAVNIWNNKTLSQTEITYLYNSGNGKQYPFT